jgi:glutamine synthetase
VFFFKRTVREAALRHDMYATFMAKPIAGEPGSAMHVHQSILEQGHRAEHLQQRGRHAVKEAFMHYIGGLQRYMPAAMVLVAPYVNSYRRLSRNTAAPINIEWGTDNRTVGIRSPIVLAAGAAGREPGDRRRCQSVRVAMAMTLACGYLGMKNKIKPKPRDEGRCLPGAVLAAAQPGRGAGLAARETDLHEVLGKEFITVYTEIKELEFDEFMKVISPWEREHLLLHV